MAAQALACWRSQTWEQKELVVIDDADDPSFPDGLQEQGVLYHLSAMRLTIGAKRNLACSLASGEAICHWDSDDWSAPGRMADQAQRLIETGAQVAGYQNLKFHDLSNGNWWCYYGTANFALGSSLMYRRSWWIRNPFKDAQIGEDNDFVQVARNAHVISVSDGGDFLHATIHAGNSSPRLIKQPTWKAIPAPVARQL